MADMRAAFVAAIHAAPSDDTPRLIFADWLDERGEVARASFIRLQCEAARLPSWTNRRADLLRRADELLLAHEREWLGVWYERLVRWEFHRGFLRAATVTGKTFVDHGEELFRLEPIDRLAFVDETGHGLAAEAVTQVVGHPAFGKLRALDIKAGGFPRWNHPRMPFEVWLRLLARTPHVNQLRTFLLAGQNPSSAFRGQDGLDESAVELFCKARHLGSLRVLNMNGRPLHPTAPNDRLIALLAGATFAPKLRRLTLSQCRLTDQAAARLAADRAFPSLRSLDVSYNRISQEGMATLFNSPTLSRLTHFNVRSTHLPALANSPLAAKLRSLTVFGSQEGNRRPAVREAWLRLLEAGGRPTHLQLNCHDPGDTVLQALRASPWARRLRSVVIINDSQSPGLFRQKAIWQLLKSNCTPRLTHLTCYEYATPVFVTALIRWRGLQRLEHLDLGDDYYGRLIPALFNSPFLSGRLRGLFGVRFEKDEDVAPFLECQRLTGLRKVALAFIGEVSQNIIDRLFRSSQLKAIEELSVHFDLHRGQCQQLPAEVYQLLADPTILPRLRRLWAGNLRSLPKHQELLHARFGSRLQF